MQSASKANLATAPFCGKWISAKPEEYFWTYINKKIPANAPYFRGIFEGRATKLRICGLGYYEVFINGKRVGDELYAPPPSQYDKRVIYSEYDIAELTHDGRNAIAVLLGNGLYNCTTKDAWAFENASWRDYPKLICDIFRGAELLLASGPDWKYHASPIAADFFRCGDVYDARCEIEGFADADFDDSEWKNAAVVQSPGGILQKQEFPPCKVGGEREYVKVTELSAASEGTSERIYDFGGNLTGRCVIEADGRAGAKISLEYSELLAENGDLDRRHAGLTFGDDFQTEHLILGGKPRTFFSRFAYFGFRYVKVKCVGGAEVKRIKAQFIHTAFASGGEIETSDETFNKLQAITRHTFLCNYIGIPTDCPHREKNGWTGDAQLACETGLWNFQAASAYKHFVRTLADTQRVSGGLPGIAPTGGWGYSGWSGPGWDSCLFELPWQIYLFTGDDSLFGELYDNMRRYVDYCDSQRNSAGLVSFGLGDWCPPSGVKIPPTELTSSAFFLDDVRKLSRIAKHLGREGDAADFSALAENLRASLSESFPRGDDTLTGKAACLYFDFYKRDSRAEAQAAEIAAELAEKVRAENHHANFGIFGGKWVPRVLAENGFAQDAFRLITQPEYPGWGNWIVRGATTLWETWDGSASQMHIMFGDISAWAFRYLAGVRLDFDGAGFREIQVKPCFIEQLSGVTMTHETPFGKLRVAWRRGVDGTPLLEVEAPSACRVIR